MHDPVMPGQGNVFPFLEGMFLKAEEGLVVLFAGGIGKGPGAMARMDQETVLGFFLTPEALHGATLLVGLPGIDINLPRRIKRQDKDVAVGRTAFGEFRRTRQLQANSLE